MAMEMVSWVSLEMAPRDMPPVQKRFMMFSAGSTSSRSTSGPAGSKLNASLRTATGALF